MPTKEPPTAIKFNDLHIRKISPDELPFFRRHPEFVRNNCFIVDLEKPINDTIKKETVNPTDQYKTTFPIAPSTEDFHMEGVEVVGEPLEVSMLSPSRIQASSLDNPLYKGYHSGIANESASLDINPLSVQDSLHFFHGFEHSDSIKTQFLKSLGFAETVPKNYTLNFFSNADDPQERTAGIMLRYADSLKYAGFLRHYGPFDGGVRSLVNYKLLAHSTDSKLRTVNCQSCYNALCNSQIITPMPKWPKFTLPDVQITYSDEVEPTQTELTENSEFIPGMFSVRTIWTESAQSKQTTLDGSNGEQFPVRYFEKPGGLFDTVVTVKPGWLDTRVKGFERSIHLRFLMYLCDCLQKTEIEWPSQKEQPKLLEAFRNFVSNLSVVENTKQSYDFVEGLWDYLCCCRSLASLRAIFKETYDYFTRGVLTSKYVHVDNCSSIALIIKTMDRLNAVLPRLDQWTCVQMLIEVGVDRLRRDLMNELTTKKRFPTSSFSESLKIEPRSTTDDRVRVILIMHLVLQSVNLISEYVTIQPPEMQTLFNSLLYQFSNSKSEKPLDEEFSFKTKVCNIESFVLEISHLREWSITHEFADKNGSRSSYTAHLTRLPELDNLAKGDFSHRFIAQNGVDTKNEQLYWDNFDCCTFTYSQKAAFPSGTTSTA